MKADKVKVSRLLKTARGQIDGILKMIEDDKYCIDVSNQIMAAEAILSKANKEILKAHIECCVRYSLQEGNDVDNKLNEIMNVIEKISK